MTGTKENLMTGTKEKLMTGDLVLRQARFPDGRQTDMVIRAGRIARIGDLPAGAEAVGPVLDCAGRPPRFFSIIPQIRPAAKRPPLDKGRRAG